MQEEIKLDEPLIDVLSPSGLKTGEKMTRKAVHATGALHKAVHLYLFNEKNDLLLQKRASNLDHYSGMYSISLTGHVDSGETGTMALKRELLEELGLSISQIQYEFAFCYRRDAQLGSYIDRQFNDVFVGITRAKLSDIKYDPAEVAGLKFVTMEEFEDMAKSKDSLLAPVYGDALYEVIDIIKGLKR